jgi:tetratricopeptide (TPR) repeat protein
MVCNEILNEVPDNALLIVGDNDLFMPLWYFAQADSTANNIKIISAIELSNSSFRKQVKRHYSDLVLPIGFDGDAYQPHDKMVAGLCELNNNRLAIYVLPGVPGIDLKNLEPHGITFRVLDQDYKSKPGADIAGKHIGMAIRMIESNPEDAVTVTLAGNWLFTAADYFKEMNKAGIARDLMRTAVEFNHDNIEMRLRLATELARAGLYKEALKYIAEALDLDPYHPAALKLGHLIAGKTEPESASVDK